MTAPVLQMRDIGKSFPGVRALDGVSFDCSAGEVHAICGENGAGKSTLIKILGGAYSPDAGSIRIDGAERVFAHPAAARRAGISIIHQELSLLPHRSVAENIFLGLEPTRGLLLDRRAMRADARSLLQRLGTVIDPDRTAAELSIAEQQTVEIAKALAVEARILVMDEPTAALDDAEARRLLDLVRRLRAQGVAVIYISHRMPEIAAVADRVSVLKDGRLMATDTIAAMPVGRIVRLMVGRDLSDFYPPRPATPPGPVLLEVVGGGSATLDGISFVLRAGEILGLAGLEGSGKTDLARAIFADRPFARGEMRLDGRRLRLAAPHAAIAAGIGYLPDDRKREALTLQQSLRDNALLALRAFAALWRPPRSGAMANAAADRVLHALDVRAAGFGQPIRALSGGNQQKVVIGRWLLRDPMMLIFCDPTRGIDVAAKAAIYRTMRDLAARGRGILMVSSDLAEIVGVSDRILVMRAGRIVGECPGGSTEEAIMGLAVHGADHALAA